MAVTIFKDATNNFSTLIDEIFFVQINHTARILEGVDLVTYVNGQRG